MGVDISVPRGAFWAARTSESEMVVSMPDSPVLTRRASAVLRHRRSRVVVASALAAVGATAAVLPGAAGARASSRCAVGARPNVELLSPRVVVHAQDQMMGNMSDDFQFQTMSYPGSS